MERLPDEKVKVKLAICPKCNGVVFAGVEHTMDKNGYKEIADCVKAGCDIITIPLLKYRKDNRDWCVCE